MISIEFIDHSHQRYKTIGDWFRDEKGLNIKVSKMTDKRHELLVAIHELVEVVLCEQRGITQAQVDQFDMDHLESDDPGSLTDAPYRKEHEFATAIEMLVAQALGVDWSEYEKEVGNLSG